MSGVCTVASAVEPQGKALEKESEADGKLFDIVAIIGCFFIGDYSHRWLGIGGGGARPTFLEIVFESQAR